MEPVKYVSSHRAQRASLCRRALTSRRSCPRTTACSLHQPSWDRRCFTRTSTTPAPRTCWCFAFLFFVWPSELLWCRKERARAATALPTTMPTETNTTACASFCQLIFAILSLSTLFQVPLLAAIDEGDFDPRATAARKMSSMLVL
jgi:hypothetical protein